MTPGRFLLLNLAFAFYNVGTIWAHEVDIFRSWRLLDATDFGRIQEAHWRKLPYWVFAPVGLALAGSFALVWYRAPAWETWPVWCAIACQLAAHTLTAACWGPWQAKLAKDTAGPNSRYLTRILATHWARTLLITASALVLLGWAVDVMASPAIPFLPPAAVVTDAGRPPAQRFHLAGRVTNPSGKHAVFVALWQADGFLQRPADGVRIEPGKPAAYRFDVARGSWALSAFEDTNDNGQLDMGVFGPKEPSGFWRRFTGWHRPSFDEVATKIDRDVDRADIELR